MIIDLDGFDKVNEEWGMQTGDSVLRETAHLVTRTLRASDIACRYRDDQFLILLTDTDASGAQIAANRATHPLFDTARFTRELERAFVSIWERQQRDGARWLG